jgi:uncharacterized protein YpmS
MQDFLLTVAVSVVLVIGVDILKTLPEKPTKSNYRFSITTKRQNLQRVIQLVLSCPRNDFIHSD